MRIAGPEREAASVDNPAGPLKLRCHPSLLKAGALQDAIFNSVHFSSIATDEKGVIQIFNVGAERMLGYAAADVLNRVTPADISDPAELIERAAKPWDDASLRVNVRDAFRHHAELHGAGAAAMQD